MDEGQDSADVRQYDPALAAWYAYRARVRNVADLVSITYGIRDPDSFQDRLLVAFDEIKNARAGRFLAVMGEGAGFVTLRDENIIGKRKAAAARLQDLLIDERAGFGFTPETQALRASLNAYLAHLDTIEFKRPKEAGRLFELARLLVRQLAARWPEIDRERAKAWPDKKRKTIGNAQVLGHPSKFSAVIGSVCALWLGLKTKEIPSNTTISRWLGEYLPKGSP